MTLLLTPTDPAAVLDPYGWSTPWAEALRRGGADAAKAAFVRELRDGPPRADTRWDPPAMLKRGGDRGVGFRQGYNFDPDLLLQKRYVGVYGIEVRFEGDIDWLHDPTRDWGERQTAEWQVQLNRHYQWVPLADAYAGTGDRRYAEHWEFELRSWCGACPRPGDNGHALPSAWRTIDTGIRAGWTWPYAFEAFRRSPHVSDEALWLFVCAMREHGVHLLNWVRARNWKAMESNGLTRVGTMFPELRQSFTFATTGIDRCLAELDRQFYPDGTQDELAPSYGWVSTSNILAALAQARHTKRPGVEVPGEAWDRLWRTAEGLGRSCDPDGVMLPLHDCDILSMAPIYADFAEHFDHGRFGRPHWREDRADLLSWAGYAIRRRPERMVMLDAGPWGTGHQHDDALQVLLHAHGRWMCIDPGKPRYDKSAMTRCMRGSHGHSVVLIDGRPHRAEPRVARTASPLPIAIAECEAFWVCSATRRFVTMDEPLARFDHERTVIDFVAGGVLVVDRITPLDDLPHAWEWLWVLGPDEVQTLDAGFIASDPSGEAVAIVSDGNAVARCSVVRGQTGDQPRGWKSLGDDKDIQPASAARVIIEPIVGPVWRATYLVPSRTPVAQLPRLTVKSVSVVALEVGVDLSNGSAVMTLRGDPDFADVTCTMRAQAMKLPLGRHRFTSLQE